MKRITFALILSFLYLLLIFTLSSCGRKSEEKPINEAIEKAYPMQDVVQERTEDVGYRVAELIYSKASYTILETNKGSCKLRVSAPDMKKMFESCFDKEKNIGFDPQTFENDVEQLNEKIEENLMAGNYEERTVDVIVPYNGGEIETTYELTDALYGGLLSAKDAWVQENIREGGKE